MKYFYVVVLNQPKGNSFQHTYSTLYCKHKKELDILSIIKDFDAKGRTSQIVYSCQISREQYNKLLEYDERGIKSLAEQS